MPSTTSPLQQERLKEIAAKLGGQSQLAKRAKVAKSTITKAIKGDRGLGTSVAKRIAAAAGVSTDYLLQEKPPREDPRVGVMRENLAFSARDGISTEEMAGNDQAAASVSPQVAKLRALELARQNGADGDILVKLMDAKPPEGRENDPWWWAEEMLRIMRAPAPAIPKR